MSDAGAAPLAPTYLPTIREELAGSTTAMAFLTEDRGLAPETLAAYGVGAATRSFPDPAGVWRDHECVVFPSITPPGGGDGDEGGGSSPDPPVAPVADADAAVSGGAEVIRAKIRAIEHKHHMRIEPKGGAWALFGMHLVPPDAREIVICEVCRFGGLCVCVCVCVRARAIRNRWHRHHADTSRLLAPTHGTGRV